MPKAADVIVLEIPARIADLAFRISIPRDWDSHDIPMEEAFRLSARQVLCQAGCLLARASAEA